MLLIVKADRCTSRSLARLIETSWCRSPQRMSMLWYIYQWQGSKILNICVLSVLLNLSFHQFISTVVALFVVAGAKEFLKHRKGACSPYAENRQWLGNFIFQRMCCVWCFFFLRNAKLERNDMSNYICQLQKILVLSYCCIKQTYWKAYDFSKGWYWSVLYIGKKLTRIFAGCWWRKIIAIVFLQK